MSQICMNSQRGTSRFHSEDYEKKWFKEENLITRISHVMEGQKISIQKGTKSIWISKKPNPAIPSTHKILIVNKGTKRLII